MEENLNVAANTDEIATSSTEAEQSISTEVTAEPTKAVEAEHQSQESDITQTQSFAKRLKEETAKAEQRALDNFIEQTYGESHGIKTYAEYQAAIERQKQEEHDQAIRNEYEAKGLPEDVVNELVEWKKSREQSNAEQEAKLQQEKQQKDMMDFIKEFPDVKPEDIPVEVWQANANGVPLSYAYAKHALEQTRKAEEIAKANAENAKSSTGSVNTNGAANDSDFVSFDSYEQNKNNQSWVNKNFDKIMKSRAKW